MSKGFLRLLVKLPAIPIIGLTIYWLYQETNSLKAQAIIEQQRYNPRKVELSADNKVIYEQAVNYISNHDGNKLLHMKQRIAYINEKIEKKISEKEQKLREIDPSEKEVADKLRLHLEQLKKLYASTEMKEITLEDLKIKEAEA